MQNKLTGMGVALVTPFQMSGNIDFSGLQKLVELNMNNGTDFLVVMGTTGESATLTADEKRSVLDFVLEINKGRLPVVYGLGGNDTGSLVKELKTFNLSGADAVLSVSPYYNKPTQEGIFQHYKAIDAATPLPVIIYNVPGRTGSNITAATTLRMAHELKNMVAIKEASGNLEQAMDIMHHKPDGFIVLSGDDAMALPMIAAGGDGVISVLGQAFPKTFSSMVAAARNNDFPNARKFHYAVYDMIRPLFSDGNPAGVKEVLRFRNICQNHVRLPLVNVSDATGKKLYDLMAAMVEGELVE